MQICIHGSGHITSRIKWTLTLRDFQGAEVSSYVFSSDSYSTDIGLIGEHWPAWPGWPENWYDVAGKTIKVVCGSDLSGESPYIKISDGLLTFIKGHIPDKARGFPLAVSAYLPVMASAQDVNGLFSENHTLPLYGALNWMMQRLNVRYFNGKRARSPDYDER